MGEICCSQCKNCLEEENKNQIITQCDEPKKNFRKSKLKNDSIKQSEIINNDNENFNTNYQNIENENQKNGNEKKGNEKKGNENNFKDNYEKADMDKLSLINKMISCTEDFQRDASERKNDIVNEFEKIIDEKENNNDYVKNLNMDKKLRNLVLNYFLDKKNNDKQNNEKENDIENIIFQNNNQKITIKLFLQMICDKNDSVEENVWKVLEENPDNVYDILKKYEEIIIVTIPISEQKIITYYFFYNFN